MAESRVLVVGATGQLGSAIARKLLASGVPIRALARNQQKLQPFAALYVLILAILGPLLTKESKLIYKGLNRLFRWEKPKQKQERGTAV